MHDQGRVEPLRHSRRPIRACDTCRRKKIRCDLGTATGPRCLNCVESDSRCAKTEVSTPKPRRPLVNDEYVKRLESQVQRMETLLKNLSRTRANGSQMASRVLFDKSTWMLQKGAGTSARARHSSFKLSAHALGEPWEHSDDEGILESSDDERHAGFLAMTAKRLKADELRHCFVGGSSDATMLASVLTSKGLIGKDTTLCDTVHHGGTRRPEYWKAPPWEDSLYRGTDSSEAYVFPADDLLPVLVDLYFSNVNHFHPLLHRPTFEKSIAEGLHKRDRGFGAVLLLVCAVAAQDSDDPRVLVDPTAQQSAGWQYFNQVKDRVVRTPPLVAPCLYDLQLYCLVIYFLSASSPTGVTWAMIGIGIRLAQDIGVHRRKVYSLKLTVEEELWKRAFWVLVHLDRGFAYGLGRPCAINDEDIDLDLPICCDDEYWETEDPEKAFQQPPDKPSYVTYFVCMIQLYRILAIALRTIYSVNKSDIMLAGCMGPKWERHVVAELDSALSKWTDSMPAHLVWTQSRKHDIFFKQSAMLYATHHHLQTMVHRPFLTALTKAAPPAATFPSLAVCKKAARACIQALDSIARDDILPIPHSAMFAFTSAVVLLLGIRAAWQHGIWVNAEQDLVAVQKCIDMLEPLEKKYRCVTPLRDLLLDLHLLADPGPGKALTGGDMVHGAEGVEHLLSRTHDSPSRPSRVVELAGVEAYTIATHNEVLGGSPAQTMTTTPTDQARPAPADSTSSSPKEHITSQPHDTAATGVTDLQNGPSSPTGPVIAAPEWTWDPTRDNGFHPSSSVRPTVAQALPSVPRSNDAQRMTSPFGGRSQAAGMDMWSDILSIFDSDDWSTYLQLVGGVGAAVDAPLENIRA